MHKRSLRIEVNNEAYEILKVQQRLYYEAKNRKISFANVILHYFFQGLENSNIKIENGLSVIEFPDLHSQSSNNVPKELQEPSNSLQYSFYDLKQREEQVEQREGRLWQRENDIAHKEWELNHSAVDVNQDTPKQSENQDLINSKAEIAEIRIELESLKKNNDSRDKIKNEFRQISRKLDKIDSQTKKTTMDLILQFANPLISLVGFFLINNKLKSSTPELEPILKEIKNIYSKLNGKEKDMISEQFNIDLDSIL